MALGAQFTMGHFQGLDNAGLPVAYGKLYFTDTFTGDQIITYKDSGLTVVNTHPIILSASGKAEIFLTSNTYNVVLTDANDVVIWSHEGYVPVGLGADPSAWREKLVAIAAQTDFIYANPVDSGTLVFVNGSLKEFGPTEDYIIVPPYTVKFNAGRTAGDEVVAFGAAPSTAVSVMYADGSVPMDEGYVPALPQDIATRDFVVSSPAFTGVPTAPTAAVGTNTAQLATAAFVMASGFASAIVDVTLLAKNTVYTNTTGKPMFVSFTFRSNLSYGEMFGGMRVNGNVVSVFREHTGSESNRVTMNHIVPPGMTYELYDTSGIVAVLNSSRIY